MAREHEQKALRTVAGMVTAVVLTMVDIVICANFGNTSAQIVELERRLESYTVKQINKVGRILGVWSRSPSNKKKGEKIDAILRTKYGVGLSAPAFDFDLDNKRKGVTLKVRLDEAGLLDIDGPKVKASSQRLTSYDYMDADKVKKHRVQLNDEGLPVSRRHGNSIKVPLLNPSTGEFKHYKNGDLKLCRMTLRVGHLDTADEERWSGRIKLGSSNHRTATVLRRVIFEGASESLLVWVAILQTDSHLIQKITLPQIVKPQEVTQALDAINKSWSFAAKIKEASASRVVECTVKKCTIDTPHICEGVEQIENAVGLIVNHPLDPRLPTNYTEKVRREHRRRVMAQIVSDRTHSMKDSIGGE